MPIQAGTTLLLNMLVQSALRLSRFKPAVCELYFSWSILMSLALLPRYNKNMVMGTLVLVLAIICLVDIGPQPQEEETPALDLVAKTPSLVWSGILVSCIVGGFVALPQVWKQNGDSLAKIVVFSILSASSNVRVLFHL